MKKYFEKLLSILGDSLNSINEEAFEQLIGDGISTLEQGHKIIISGLGKNVPVCEKFVGTMVSLGLDACYMNTNSAVHGDLGMVHAGDLVIILTKSGETKESIHLYHLLEERDCTIWMISFNHDSYLAKKIEKTIIIHLEHEGDEWNIVPNNSTTLNLIVLQMLAMRISNKMQIPLETFKKNHPGGYIGEMLKYYE